MLRCPRVQNGHAGWRPEHAAAGRLDVHDVGTEVGQQLADMRPGQRVREVDCPQTVQRAPHGPGVYADPHLPADEPMT